MKKYFLFNRSISLIPIITLLFATFIFYFPLLLNPKLLLNRNNDLSEVFWPIFYFIRTNIINNHQLPMWNNLFFAGTPLLPDPQFSLFYPLNLIYILFPTDFAFFVYLMLHSLIGGFGIYIFCKNILNFDIRSSIFTSLLYLFTPKTAMYLTAGHAGLVAATAWIPFLLYATLMLTRKNQLKWVILYAVSLASVFYTHTIIFLVAAIVSVIVFICSYLINTYPFKALLFLTAGLILTVGLIAVALLPQLEWMPQTTRFLLLSTREVYPTWNSIIEVIHLFIFPYNLNDSTLNSSEKWISVGFIPLILTGYGFIFVRRRLQILLFSTLIVSAVIMLNNSSPLHQFLISQDFYVLMRVSTRIWFIPFLIIIFLAGYGLKKLSQNKQLKSLAFILACLTLIESIATSWIILTKPITHSNTPIPVQLYEFLKSDTDHFRVYCTTRCLSQKQAAIYNLELVDGYNTLQQQNFYKQSWQLMGGYWNYYTLAIPPLGSYKFENLQPDPISLGDFNTKYVISPYKLTNPQFVLQANIESYYVYTNIHYHSRAYFLSDKLKYFQDAKISQFSPNAIQVETKDSPSNKLVLSEVYNSGWKAYLNGQEAVIVQEKPNILRQIDLKEDTQFVVFKYEPDSYKIGQVITFITLFLILLALISKLRFFKRIPLLKSFY